MHKGKVSHFARYVLAQIDLESDRHLCTPTRIARGSARFSANEWQKMVTKVSNLLLENRNRKSR